jgi:hypothetical protein
MHDEAGGIVFVINLRLQKWWAADVRKHLRAAGITRAALFETAPHASACAAMTSAAHASRGWPSAATTAQDSAARRSHVVRDAQKYIRTAEAVGEVIGAVFPALPAALLSPLNGLANRPKDPQAVDFIVEAPGIEHRGSRRILGQAA